MTYSTNDIISAVRKTLDENEVSNSLVMGDALSLDVIIQQMIVDGARIILESSPNKLLEEGVNLPTSITWETSEGIGMGHILLPDDFCRLAIFKMSDWERAVTTTITSAEPQYAKCRSKYIGIAGGTAKPICAITSNSIGKIMEFYSCRQGEGVKISIAQYHPYPSIEKSMININRDLYTPTIYYIAGLTALVYKDTVQSNNLMAEALKYLQ